MGNGNRIVSLAFKDKLCSLQNLTRFSKDNEKKGSDFSLNLKHGLLHLVQVTELLLNLD